MTFLELQERIMDRLNLSTDEARERIKDFINERYRNVQTSCGLTRTRKGTITFSTVQDQADYTPLVDDDDPTIGVIKPLTIRDSTATGRPPYSEISLDAYRRSPLLSESPNRPHTFVVTNFGASGCTVKFYPTPDAVYALTVDGLLNGVDLVDDTDEPAFPEDFHDILIFGALADEYDHFDKTPHAGKQEKKFEKRLGELRYFIAKSVYLTRVQGRTMESVWWWRPVV